MSGWVDASAIDPVGIVEKEESCLMDLVEVLVEIGRDEYGLYVAANDGLDEDVATPMKKIATRRKRKMVERELSTISEGESVESQLSRTSISTLRPIRDKADEILSRIHDLNTSLRPSSPTTTTISRATQTSFSPPQEKARRQLNFNFNTPKRPSRIQHRRREKAIQTDDDTESGIPSSIPLSYESDSSPSTPRISHSSIPLNVRHRRLSQLSSQSIPASPIRSRSRTVLSHSSDSGFRVDSPYTAALRRRRQLNLEALRRQSHPRRRRIRVFTKGRDVSDSTFAEDSDPATPQSQRTREKRRLNERRVVSDAESTSDMLTDLESRVKALRIWSGLEEERKLYLMNEIRKRKETLFGNGREEYEGEEMQSRRRSISIGSGSDMEDLGIGYR